MSSMPERLDQGAASCIETFGGAINTITQQKHLRFRTLSDVVVDEQDRFILWATNLGVFASVNQSLDFRLRDVPDMARLFLLQLKSIRSSLEELQRLRFDDLGATVDPNEPFRPWQMRELVLELPEENADGLEEPLLSEPRKAKDLLEAVHESIEWLYRLSNMVRRASLVSQNRRAVKREMTEQVEEYLSKRMDLEISDSLNNAGPTDKDETASDNDSLWVVLKERLIRTMIIRYSRILYRRDRVRDNRSYALERTSPPSMEVAVSEPRQVNSPEVPVLTVTEPQKQPSVLPDRFHATTINESLLSKQFRPQPSQALSSAPSRVSQVEEIYPTAPKVEDGRSFTCSICCCILSANEGRGQAWKKHIECDLDHYICLFHPCPCPDELYSSRQDWLTHIHSQHKRQWVCTFVEHGKSVRFDEVEVFQGHMRQFHSESFKEDELGIVVDACEVPANPIFERCPFNCVKGIKEESTEDHVEHHLRAIALRSLPDPDHDSVFGLFPSTNASEASDRETENEEHKVRRDTIYGSEVESPPAWEPWPPQIESSGVFEPMETEKDDLIPETPHYFFESMGIPAMEKRFGEDLSTTIQRQISESQFPPGVRALFAPRRVLNAINERSLTRHVLSKADNGSLLYDDFDDLIKYILTNLKEIFAIGVAISMPTMLLVKLLQFFREVNLKDGDLPDFDKKATEVFGELSHSFIRHRYMFQAPVLSQSLRHIKRDLHEQIPLPIDLCDNTPVQGRFCRVYRVRIHGMFLSETEPINERTRMAAIKQFPEGENPKAWQREMAALKAIGSRNFPHVVDVRGIFTQASNIYFVFPWADGGNIYDFWSRHDSYASRCHLATYFIPGIMRQLRELSARLESLHDFNRDGKVSYRHGDLKPENILVFLSRQDSDIEIGTWKISDLGLAKMQEEVIGERSALQATSFRGWGTTSYKPPEAFSQPNYPTTRLFDIWSIGCILLQLITWLVYGLEGVRELSLKTCWGDKPSCFWIGDFQATRGFYNITVHHEVTKVVGKLKEHLRESPALSELLEVIENKLLVIETSPPKVPEVLRHRTDARGLYESLRIICQRCDQSDLYWSSSWKTVYDSAPRVQVEDASSNAQRGGNVRPTL